jgi:hypothetical protein
MGDKNSDVTIKMLTVSDTSTQQHQRLHLLLTAQQVLLTAGAWR